MFKTEQQYLTKNININIRKKESVRFQKNIKPVCVILVFKHRVVSPLLVVCNNAVFSSRGQINI